MNYELTVFEYGLLILAALIVVISTFVYLFQMIDHIRECKKTQRSTAEVLGMHEKMIELDNRYKDELKLRMHYQEKVKQLNAGVKLLAAKQKRFNACKMKKKDKTM